MTSAQRAKANESRDRQHDNPARKRQQRRERVEKPAPDSIDQTQEDVADREAPIGEPRGN